MLNVLLIAFVVFSAAESVSPARRLEERFLAPCCWRENLAVHRSPEADAMRTEIRQLVSSGMTEDEIVAFFTTRYGQRILREPQGGPALWLRVVPLFVLAMGVLLVASYIVHARRRKPRLTTDAVPAHDDEDWL